MPLSFMIGHSHLYHQLSINQSLCTELLTDGIILSFIVKYSYMTIRVSACHVDVIFIFIVKWDPI